MTHDFSIEGVGFGLAVIPPVIEISYYFEKKRPVALGIAMCGTGTGFLLFAPIARYIHEELSWQNANFVYGKKHLR